MSRKFEYEDPAAGSVALVGGFNGWDPDRHILRRVSEDGLWEITIPLEGGIWRYAFVVDGEWKPPQESPRYEDDGFGGRNGILEVPVSQRDESVTGDEKSRHNR